jgi:hypothetical protein
MSLQGTQQGGGGNRGNLGTDRWHQPPHISEFNFLAIFRALTIPLGPNTRIKSQATLQVSSGPELLLIKSDLLRHNVHTEKFNIS